MFDYLSPPHTYVDRSTLSLGSRPGWEQRDYIRAAMEAAADMPHMFTPDKDWTGCSFSPNKAGWYYCIESTRQMYARNDHA